MFRTHYRYEETLWKRVTDRGPPKGFLDEKVVCGICRAMRPVFYRKTNNEEIPHTAYRIHSESYPDLYDSQQAKCYICARLFTKLSAIICEGKFEFRPITYYFAATKARDGEDIMKSAELQFYFKATMSGNSRMIFLDSLHFTWLTPCRYDAECL